MRLRITTPLTVVVDEDAVQIVSAEDASGGFGIQPHHADFLTSLAVGVVSWKGRRGARHYCAVDGGLLTVIDGQDVTVVTRQAIPANDRATLDQVLLQHFGDDAAVLQAARVDSANQLQAIQEIVRHLQPRVLLGQ